MNVGSGCPLCAEQAHLDGQLLLVLDIDEDIDPRLGEWCPRCALPSGAAFTISARCDHGWPQSVEVPDVVVCLDCDALIAPLKPPTLTNVVEAMWSDAGNTGP